MFVSLFFFRSSQLKIWMSFPDYMSSVCLWKFHIFNFLHQAHWSNFNPNYVKIIIGWKRFKFVSIQVQSHFNRGDNDEIANYINEIFKSSAPFQMPVNGPISTTIGKKHPWMEWTKIFRNKDHSILKKVLTIIVIK